jgi:hypothetical protein
MDHPDALPATNPQCVFIVPEFVARWRAEAKVGQST